MNVGLFLINAILLTRLFLLFRDKPMSKSRVGAMCAAQVATLLLLEPSVSAVWMGIGLIAINGAWFQVEKRYPGQFNLIRAGILAITLVLLGFASSSAAGLSFNSALTSGMHRIGPYFAMADYLLVINWKAVHSYVLGALLCMNEANMVVRMVIERLDLRPDEKKPGAGVVVRLNIEYKRGRVIGTLERMTLFFLVLEGQFGALGFVIAAKTMARFKNLEDRDFAEYFLVGTFLSLVTAGSLAMFTRWMLA